MVFWEVSHYFKKPAHGCWKAGGSEWFFDHPTIPGSMKSGRMLFRGNLLTCVCVGMCGGASLKCVVFNIRSGHFF